MLSISWSDCINIIGKEKLEKDDCKKLAKINLAIALNILHAKNERKYSACVSKHNSKREKQIILLMVSKLEG